jgi:hypothetical protein
LLVDFRVKVVTKNVAVNATALLILILILPEFSAMPNATDDKDPQFQATPSKTAGFSAHILVPRLIAVERKTTWQ